MNAALLRALPFHEPGQLVQLSADLPGVGSHNVGFSYPELEDIRDRAGIFRAVSAVWQAPGNLTGGDHPERIDILAVSPNYFNILGTRPQLGRLFDPQDIADGFAEAAVISNSLWHKEFGGDQNILGRRLRLDNDLYTVVGVLPPSFRPPTAASARPVDIWVTAGFHALPFPSPARSTRFIPGIIARLKPGISIHQAQAHLGAFASSLQHDYGSDYPSTSGWTLTLVPLKDIVVGNSGTLLVSLLLAVAFLLLIACVNVANILLANASSRQHEIAIRMALGADRVRIIRQLLTESAVLSLIAAVIGTLAATLSLRFLTTLLPSQLPHVNAITVDGRVLAFSLATALLTTVLFGLVPALQTSKSNPDVTGLRERGISASLHSSRIGRTLISAEVALSLMLLVAAGLLLKTFWELLHVDPGFQSSHLVAGNVWLPAPNNPDSDIYAKPEQRTVLIREMLRRLATIPGVDSAAISGVVPLQDSPLPVGFRVEGIPEQGDPPTAVRTSVTPDFFRTLGASLIRGRFIQDTDTNQSPLVVLVDQAAAHRFWGDSDPVGRRIHFSRDFVVDGKPQHAPWMTVIGVVNNIKLASLDEQNLPHVYVSMYQSSGKLFGVLVRGTGDTAILGQAIEHQIQSIDPNLPVSNITAMEEIVNNGVSDRRFAAWLLAIFAVVALMLTSVGIYGVTSYAVTRRTKELGIRSALGASPSDLVRMVLRNGMSPVVVGLMIGGIGAISIGRLLTGLLYSVKPTDLVVLTAAGITTVFIGIAANYLPARRAARINPIVALRAE